jgi:uncharacterized membrane protein
MPDNQTANPKDHTFVNLHRLEALGDALFAFALTLLALDLRLPDLGTTGLAESLVALGPRLAIFLLAFLTIANQWDVHQRTMLRVVRADGLFVWLNLLSLMFVTLLPASVDILGRYSTQPLALTCFALNMLLLGLSSWLMWKHASDNRRLVDEQIDASLITMLSRLWLMSPLVFALTIPLSLISVPLVYLVWLLLPIISYTSIGMRLRRYNKASEIS